ncbi:twin-arginine translocation pathway signal [Mycobacterium sp. ML4]
MRNRTSRKRSKWSPKVGVVILTLVTLGSLVGLAGVYWFSYRPDHAVNAAAAKEAIAAASDGTIAILSYSPDTLDRDFSTARAHLTGDFLSYYDQFTQQIVAPAAKQKAVKTTAVVLRGALTEFHPDSAVVLLFINQSTQSRDRPEPATSSSSVLVTLTKADGKWLISQFNPA